MYRILSTGFLLAGLALLGLAAFDYFGPAGAPGVAVDEPERAFPDAAAGQTIKAAFAVRNPTRHTARVVGLAEC